MLQKNTRPRALLLAAPLLAPAAHASEPVYGPHTLLNPTPRELMRPMSTDRPDTTESPHTVDAGHIQIEMSILDFTRNDDGPRADSYSYAQTNLKIGLLNNTDLQLVLSPYDRSRIEDGDDSSGFGDTQLRLKVNLWGNDEGDTALALMPYIKIPTGDDDLSNGSVEGGLIIPLAIALPADFSLGLMAEFDIVRDQADSGYELDFVHTATISRDLFGPLAAYIEYVGVIGTDPALEYRATFDAGVTIGVTPDLQLDTGVRVGLTDSADDLGVFVGVSFRY